MSIPGNLAFNTSRIAGEMYKKLQESNNNYINCPLCGNELTHKVVGETHIYICEPCPFVGFEYVTKENLLDLMIYLSEGSVTEVERMAQLVVDVCKIWHEDREKMQDDCNEMEGDDL